MQRYIDADEALRMMRNTKEDNPLHLSNKGIWDIAHDCCISCVDAIPTADVVPRAEVDLYRRQVDELEDELASTYDKLELAKKEVAREIFEAIEAVLAVHTLSDKSKEYADGAFDTLEWVDAKIAEIKKKYTEGVKSN